MFNELEKVLASGILVHDMNFRSLCVSSLIIYSNKILIPSYDNCRGAMCSMSSIYSVLQPAADRVEYCHRVQWEEATKGMSPLQYDAHIILARTCII